MPINIPIARLLNSATIGHRRSGWVALLFLFLAFWLILPEHTAAQIDPDETLSVAAHSEFDTGIYYSLNRLPESIRKTAPFARYLYELEREAGPSGRIDHEARYQAFLQSQQDLYNTSLEASKSSAPKFGILSNAWTNIGPNVVTSGGTTTVGGSTNAIVIDPNNETVMYAGAAGGGVWKSTNSGSNWTELTDLVIPDLAVSSIAIDPSNSNTVYVGSGDGYGAADALGGTGLYKSTDAGASWARIGSSTFSSGVVKVLVDPKNPNIVFASGYGGAQGLYRSTNYGTSWSKVYASGGVVWDICYGGALGPSGVFFLADGNDGGGRSSNCGIYKSLDDGATWTKVILGMPNGDSIGRAAVVCPSGNTSKVYALFALSSISSDYGDLLGLYKSTNAGSAFSKVSGVPSSVMIASNPAAQGWYDLMLAISPNAATSDSLYIGGIEGWYSWGGSSWHEFAGYNVNTGVHVDLHSVALNPANPRQIFVGTDGGIYYSGNAGSSWSARSNGYSTLRFYRLALDRNNSRSTYGGAQDEGTWLTVDGAAQGPEIFGGDGFQPVVDYTNSNVYYGEGSFGIIYNSSGNSITNSIDNSDPGAWVTPFTISPHNHLQLLSARTNLWSTTNGGSSWTSLGGTINSGHLATAIGLSPASAQVMWVGFNSSLFLSTNAGSTWTAKASPSAAVLGIACHPTNPSWALVALSGSAAERVMLTTNQGSSWKNVSGSGTTKLPSVNVNAVALDSVNPSSTWYAATDNGMYFTVDTGKTWSIAGSGIGLAPCWDVQVHANKTTIRVATHGRGFYEAAANALPVELDALTATTTPTGTQLTWHTDSEVNNLQFNVMRSYNAGAFEQVGTVASSAQGGSSSVPLYYSYFDSKHDTGSYIFQLAQQDLDGALHYSNFVQVHYGPEAFQLLQNYPNPFVLGGPGSESTTRIGYSISSGGAVSLKLYSYDGSLVRTLLDNQPQTAGPQDYFWDGRDASGRPVANGVYYYVLETAGSKLMNKMIVLH